MTYEEMIKGCVKNDNKSQKFLCEKYHPKFMGLCIRYSGNENDAQDMLQNGFIQIFKGFKKFNAKGSNEGRLINWMRKIFINAYLMELEKNKLLNLVDFNSEDFKHPTTEEEEDIKDNWIMTEKVGVLTAEEVHKSFDTLTESERIVFNTIVIDGYSIKEVANEIDMKYQAVSSTLFRAKKKLRR